MLNKFFKPKQKQTAKVLENGILDVGTERFRKICAVHENGTYNVADGYMYDDDYIIERDELLKGGLIPAQKIARTIPIEDIAQHYGRSSSDDTPSKGTIAATTASQKLIRLVEEAARGRASDIEISQHDLKTVIRVKMAGRWQSFGDPWTPEEGLQALTFAFNAADSGTGHTSMQKMVMQSFSINHKPGFPLPDNVIKLRGQKGYHESLSGIGQHMVFRLFYSDDDPVAGDLDDLGFDKEIFDALEHERKSKQGCVIIGGSTGDGKSTTLIRTIDRLSAECDGHIKVVTVEDPVEYVSQAKGVTQIPVKSSGDGEARKAQYRTTLMHAMRINPDVCVVSEIRDAYGSKEVMQFVASGHKVYTTIHVGSANKILFRLIEMGVPAAELSGGDITLLMKQTLIPRLCDDCKIPVDKAELGILINKYDLASNATLFKRKVSGCEQCLEDTTEMSRAAWAGYSRLTAVAECIIPDETYFTFVAAHNEAGARQHWLRPINESGLGGTTLSQKLASMLSTGDIDADDAREHGLRAVIQKRSAECLKLV